MVYRPSFPVFIPHATTHLVAASPLALAPVGSTAEVRTTSAEVGSTAAESARTLLVDNGSAGLAVLGGARGLSRCSGLVLVVALSVASLATVAAVQVLVLDIVLRSAVTGGRAAAVEVAVGSGAGAGYTALSVTADIDVGDRLGETGGGRGTGLGRAGLHGRGGRLARRAGAGEGVEAGGGIAVVDSGSAPSVLGAWRNVSIVYF
jgi:hypothetical protein